MFLPLSTSDPPPPPLPARLTEAEEAIALKLIAYHPDRWKGSSADPVDLNYGAQDFAAYEAKSSQGTIVRVVHEKADHGRGYIEAHKIFIDRRHAEDVGEVCAEYIYEALIDVTLDLYDQKDAWRRKYDVDFDLRRREAERVAERERLIKEEEQPRQNRSTIDKL